MVRKAVGNQPQQPLAEWTQHGPKMDYKWAQIDLCEQDNGPI